MALITANLMVPSALSNWAQQHMGTILLTADQWCFIANRSIPSSTGSCPSLDDATLKCCGFNGSNRNSMPKITADQFVSCALNAQQAAASNNQGPGGTTGTGTGAAPGGGAGTGAPPPGTTTGQGVLGLTNCSICQQLSKNPIMLVVLAVAIWYLFLSD